MAVSPVLLRLLGATPRLGRLFTDEQAQRGADGVVLLSHGAWIRRFGANPDVVGTRSTGGFGLLRANRARAVLAVSQVALALVLLVGAVLLLRSFVTLVTVDRGYDPTNVITASARRPSTFSAGWATREDRVEEQASRRRFYRELDEAMDGLARLPDVEAVGVTSRLPLAGSGSVQQRAHVPGRSVPDDPSESLGTLLHVVSPGYFDVLRLRLVSGRLFTRRDGAGTPRVLVVNATFAREVLGGAAGRRAAGALRRCRLGRFRW